MKYLIKEHDVLNKAEFDAMTFTYVWLRPVSPGFSCQGAKFHGRGPFSNKGASFLIHRSLRLVKIGHRLDIFALMDASAPRWGL